jgi:photosystem II stability/assembly factor-like uncharacterized protein
MESNARPAQGSGARARSPQARRQFWLAASLGLLVLSLSMAVGDVAPPDIGRRTEGRLRTLFERPESQPERRLPVLSGPLNALDVGNDGLNVWVVGNGGVVLHTPDGGATWERRSLESAHEGAAVAVAEAPGARSIHLALARLDAGLVGLAHAEARPPDSAMKGESKPIDIRQQTNAPPYVQDRIRALEAAKARLQKPPTDTSYRPVIPTRPVPRLPPVKKPGTARPDSAVVVHPAPPWRPATAPDLVAVRFWTSLDGWVLGREGTKFFTSDGGRTWVRDSSRRYAQDLRDFGMGPGTNDVWCIDHAGSLLLRAQGGPWRRASSPPGVSWKFAALSPGSDKGLRGLVVGDLRARSGGGNGPATSTRVVGLIESSGPAGVSSVQVRLARDTEAATTIDALRHPLPAGIEPRAALSLKGACWRADSTEYRPSWPLQPARTTRTRADSALVRTITRIRATPDGRHAWAIGMDGQVLSWSAADPAWCAQSLSRAEQFDFARIDPDLRHVWVRSYSGWWSASRDGGRHWQPLASPPPLSVWGAGADPPPATIAMDTLGFAAAGRARAVDSLHSAARAPLVALRMDARGERGLAVLASHEVRATIDGGRTWTEMNPYRGGLPLATVVCLLLAIAALAAAWRPEAETSAEMSIAEKAASDRPLQPGEFDALKSGEVAHALFRFIQNRNTSPPLTIGVVGDWGTGKTSIMRLLEANLRDGGMRPIWFNAWHHQKEQQLFSALLRAIRRQVMPAWWTPRGLMARVALLLRRGFGGFVSLAILLVTGAALLGLLAMEQFSLPRSIQTLVSASRQVNGDLERFLEQSGLANPPDTSSANAWSDSPKSPPEARAGGAGAVAVITNGGPSKPVPSPTPVPQQGGRPQDKPPGNVASSIAALVGLIAVLRQVQGQLSAFGAGSWKWLDWMKGVAGFGSEETPATTRMDFAEQFKEVVGALGDTRLVVLVDDLDRCRPENVVELLEAVNFLVTTAPCFVVLGFDARWVKASVMLQYEKIATAVGAFDVNADGADEQTQEHFAVNYLEKLVNIEVPVPKANVDDFGNLMRASDVGLNLKEKESRDDRLVRWSGVLAGTVRTWTPRLAIVALATLGFLLGRSGLDAYLGRDSVTAELAVAPSHGNGGGPDTVGRAVRVAQDQVANAAAGGAEWIDVRSLLPTQIAGTVRANRRVHFALLFVCILVTFVLAIVAYFNRPRMGPGDSERFNGAVRVWDDLVYLRRDTPRAAKQFKNRVRLYAMRCRKYGAPRPQVLRFFDWLAGVPAGMFALAALFRPRRRRDEPVLPATPEEIADAALVALGAIENAQSEWLIDDANWEALCACAFERLQPGRPEMAELLERLVEEHRALDPTQQTWPPAEELRRRVVEFATGQVLPSPERKRTAAAD